MQRQRIINILIAFVFAFCFISTPVFTAGAPEQQNGQKQNAADADDVDADDADDTDTGGGMPATSGTQSTGMSAIPKKYVKFNGDLMLGLNMGLHKPNKWYRKAAELILSVEARFMDVSFKGELEFMYDTLRDNVIIEGQQVNNYKRYLRPRELWVEYESSTFERKWFSGVSFKAGHVLYSWGKGDEYRPSDIINPQDYSNYSFTPGNDRKIPVWSLNVKTRFHENWRWSFIIVPVHKGNELPGENNPWQDPSMQKMQALGITSISLTGPEAKLVNSTYAIKTYFKVFDVDFSIGYLSGYGNQPVLTGIAPPTANMEYKYLRMITFDFEFVLGGIGWRGEIAYFPQGKYFTQDTPPTNPAMIERKQIAAIFGFDKLDLFVKGMYINIQVIFEHIFDRDDGNVIAKENIFSVSLNWYYEGRKFKIEIGGIYGITNKELMLRPKITWKAQNDFNVLLGAILIFGKNSYEYSQAPLGKFFNKDYIFIEANYSF